MSTPLPLVLYSAAMAALEPLAPSLLRARARRGKEDPGRLSERLGRAGLPRPEGALIWLHGVCLQFCTGRLWLRCKKAQSLKKQFYMF